MFQNTLKLACINRMNFIKSPFIYYMKYNFFHKSQDHHYEPVILSTDAYLGLYWGIRMSAYMHNADLKKQTLVGD